MTHMGYFFLKSEEGEELNNYLLSGCCGFFEECCVLLYMSPEI